MKPDIPLNRYGSMVQGVTQRTYDYWAKISPKWPKGQKEHIFYSEQFPEQKRRTKKSQRSKNIKESNETACFEIKYHPEEVCRKNLTEEAYGTDGVL